MIILYAIIALAGFAGSAVFWVMARSGTEADNLLRKCSPKKFE